MHGCFNGIGLWFIEGVAGVRVHASEDPPITIRAGVDAGDITWAKGHRAAPCGQVASSWQLGGGLGLGGFHHNVTVPGNARAKVAIPASSASEITEGGKPLAEAKGVTVVGDETVNQVHYVVLTVMSGEYKFSSNWTRSEVGLV
jgi:alpha-L-rhamnosidase